MRLPGPLTADQERQLRTVQGSAKHLLSLINDLLDLAKVESGKLELQPELVSCRELLESLSATLRPLAEVKGLALDVLLPDGDVALRTDRRALSQVLMNLATNAIKFTDAGRVSIEVQRRAPGIAIVVADTGVGIRREEMPKLFAAFQRVGDQWRREGTGLGLYLSQKLAKLMGGHIEVESVPQSGSRFSLLLGAR